jgi:hypothetical protein
MTNEPDRAPREAEAMTPADPSPTETMAVPPPSRPPSAVESVDAGGAPGDRTPAHAVPPTGSVGESVKCPRCGTENRPGVGFCRQCGQRLVSAADATLARPGAPEGTQACPRCGTHNRAGITFCQNCGYNLRGRAPDAAAAGYVPPPIAEAELEGAPVAERRGAVLGPVVLLVAAVGLVVGWLLPFAYGGGSLYERAFGASSGYGVAFWTAYERLEPALADQAYFGFAAPSPLLVLLLVVLAVAGFVRASPGPLQVVGLLIALVWSIGLAALFVLVELLGAQGGEITAFLRSLSPGGIIYLLAALIAVIGILTRFARS